MSKIKGFDFLMLNAIFPPKCIFCGSFVKDSDFKICKNCLQCLPFNTNKCKVCGRPLDTVYGERLCAECRKRRPFVRAFVPLKYSGSVRHSILKFKFYGKNSYAKTFAALILIEIKKSDCIFDAITFVPIHFLKYGMRGYNQSELIAKHLAAMLGIPCFKMLRKTKNTIPLSKLPITMRAKTVSGVFSPLNNSRIANKRILLVDDIITTGATCCECSRVLKKAGAAEVYIGAIASPE